MPVKHRPASENCPTDRALPPVTNPPQASTCTAHEDCKAGTNGRCLAQPRTGIYNCSYDTCATDADCKGGGANAHNVCACRQPASAGANYCLAGNCSTDADCGGNYCSPSFGDCGHYGGVQMYYCHGAKDECINDADCPASGPYQQDGACRYNTQVGHFQCSTSECAG